jgi:hypothetical protein
MRAKWTPDRRVSWSFEGSLIVPKMMSALYWWLFSHRPSTAAVLARVKAGTEVMLQRSMIVHCAQAKCEQRLRRAPSS